MKAALYHPALDTLGGGGVYIATVAQCLLQQGYQVDFFWGDGRILKRIDKYLGIDLDKVKVNVYGHFLFSKKGEVIKKRSLLKQYDVSFFVSDGSIPWLFADKNILHFQIPFKHGSGRTLSNWLKLKNIHSTVCNSQFTKRFIDKTYGVYSSVIYPPINIAVQEKKKTNTILAVGRFTTALHNKRQDILVKAFKSMVDNGLTDWVLRIIGDATETEGKQLLNTIRTEAIGYPIDIVTNISHARLEKEYAKAKIFWHAAGFDIDEEKFPEQVEHFGIATVEAMAAGCVPVVLNKGGQPEIVRDEKNGILWNSIGQLQEKTFKLIKDEKQQVIFRLVAKKALRKYSKARFCKELKDTIYSMNKN